jgi:hypothetical protein
MHLVVPNDADPGGSEDINASVTFRFLQGGLLRRAVLAG